MKETGQFSWTLLFVVTGASFLIFSGLTRLLDGPSTHVALFFKIAIASSLSALISFVVELLIGPGETSHRKYSSARKE